MPPLSPPWTILALINRDSLLFDPRVMTALEAALGLTPEEVAAAVEAYLEDTPLVAGQNGMAAIWKGTQAEFDGIATQDPNTLYIIL